MIDHTFQPMKKGEKTQTKILEKAARLFAKSGYKGVTIDRIANSAGLTKGSLYSHFKSKHEIYVQSLYWYFSSRIENGPSALRDVKDDLEQFCSFLSWLIDLFKNDEIFTLLMLRLIVDSDTSAIRSVIPSVFTDTVTRMMNFIEKNSPSKDPREYAFSLASIILLNRNLETFFTELTSGQATSKETSRMPLLDHLLEILAIKPGATG